MVHVLLCHWGDRLQHIGGAWSATKDWSGQNDLAGHRDRSGSKLYEPHTDIFHGFQVIFMLFGPINVIKKQRWRDYYRSPRWHRLHGLHHTIATVTLFWPQKETSYTEKCWIEWHPAYNDSFSCSQGCHCNRGALYTRGITGFIRPEGVLMLPKEL